MPSASVLFAYLIKLSLVLVPNAQLQTSAGLELPLGWVFAAIPIGAALIILPMLRNILVASREPMAETLLIIFIVFILLGMPISIAMGVGALGAAMLFPTLNPIIIPTRFVGLLSNSYLLLSAPLFILAGNIAARGGVARVIIDLATALVGRFRGGLAYVNVVDSMFFGGISGSAVADVSALGTFLIPQMVRKGYDLDFATALTVSHGSRGADHPAVDHCGDLRLDGGKVGGGHVRGRRSFRACWSAPAWRCRCSLSPGSATIRRSRRPRSRSSWPCCAMRSPP